jgi:DNA modification methylase
MSQKNKKAGVNLLFNPYTELEQKENDKKVMAKDKYGFLPKSIWSLKKDAILVAHVADMISKGSYGDGKKKKGQKDLSLLNPTVVYNILKYYSEPGDIIMAPYSSRGVVGLVAHLMGRNSFNTEIVSTYHTDMLRRAKDVYKPDSGLALEFYLDDARTMKSIPSNFADLTYFNPPYWCVEKYESTDGQMSDCGTYEEFLEFYTDAIKAKYRVTKPGGWCIANLNDFRIEGVFYNFHGDTIRLMQEAGFYYHDIIINEIFSRSITSIGSVEKSGRKTMAKTHEYILIFKKPFEDGTVWTNWHEFRANQRKVVNPFAIKKFHAKRGIEVDEGYSWEWGEK